MDAYVGIPRSRDAGLSVTDGCPANSVDVAKETGTESGVRTVVPNPAELI